MLSQTSFDLVRALVRRRAGLDLGPEKVYLVDARLSPVARDAGYPTIDALVVATGLAPDGPITRRVIEAMLTSETSFFRDPSAFEQLGAWVLPELAASRAASRQVTIWCAACASGQEPYGVAMVILERFAHLIASAWSFSVIATDLSEGMVERAQAGVYTQLEVNRGLPARYLVNHFVRRGVDWQVRDEVRRLVEVRRLNLIDDPLPARHLDVVLLRNVLIYFPNDLKRAVLERVRAVLRPDGFLFLGGAETTLGLHDGYEPMGPGRPGWYRPRATSGEATRAVPRG